MHFPEADNFYILLPIHSPTQLQVLNKNGGPIQSIFKDKSLTVLKWALAVRQNCFFQMFYTVGSVVNRDPVETLSITSKQVQKLSKFANKNKSSGIFYQYYKYEYYND